MVGNTLGFLHSQVDMLERILNRSVADTDVSVDTVRQQAKGAGFDPELAVAVARRLSPDEAERFLRQRFTHDDVSEALLQHIAEEDTKQLARRDTLLSTLRAILQDQARPLGAALCEIYVLLGPMCLKWEPRLPDLHAELAAILAKAQGDPAELERLLSKSGFAAWKAALLRGWLKRRRPGVAFTEEAFEELLVDEEIMDPMRDEGDFGPIWIYAAQARAVQSMRRCGRALVAIAQEVGA